MLNFCLSVYLKKEKNAFSITLLHRGLLGFQLSSQSHFCHQVKLLQYVPIRLFSNPQVISLQLEDNQIMARERTSTVVGISMTTTIMLGIICYNQEMVSSQFCYFSNLTKYLSIRRQSVLDHYQIFFFLECLYNIKYLLHFEKIGKSP